MTTTQITAAEAYEANANRALELVENIVPAITENHVAPGTEGIDWSNVGDMNEIVRRLEALTAFIDGTEK